MAVVFEPLKTVGKPLRDQSCQARQGFRGQFRAWMPLAPGAERVLPGNSGFCSVRAYPQGILDRLEITGDSGSDGQRRPQFDDAIHPRQGSCVGTQGLQLCSQVSHSLVMRPVCITVGMDVARLPPGRRFARAPQ